MIVIHALWNHLESGKLHLWAESSSVSTSTQKKRPRSTTSQVSSGGAVAVATKTARRTTAQAEELKTGHPFALPANLLKEAMGELAGSPLVAEMGSGRLTMRLPSTAKSPLPSPELILEDESEDLKATAFQSWDIDTLALEPGSALDFLLALPENPPHGVVYGSSLRFWAMAAAFTSELLARQCYVPTVQGARRNGNSTSSMVGVPLAGTLDASSMVGVPAAGTQDVFRAAWEGALTPEDAERMQLLSSMMPAVCRAFLPAGDKKSSLLQSILMHFIDASIDAFVRTSLSGAELLPKRRSRSAKGQPLPEQWLRGLTAEDATLKASSEELRDFAAAMQDWLVQVRPVEAGAAFRTCFRLDAPSEEDGDGKNWHVSFHLQANDDRSLLVPADKVWKERSSTLTFLKRKFENPQERLLADLGKATRLFPAIEESLKTARPRALKLNTEQAYTFLRQSAPLLEQSGFGVLVPPWWQKPAARLGVKLKIKPKAGAAANSGLLGLNSIVDYDWTVSIGDTTLSAKEFENLVNLKMPLIKVRGQWVELRPEEIEAAIAFFEKKRRNGDMALGEALRLGLGQGTSEVGLPIVDVEGDGWIKDLLAELSDSAKITPVETPATFQGILRPYQLKGVSWLAFLQQFGFGSCLADDMGLGKCLAASSLITINGVLQKAEDIWNLNAGEPTFDGAGYWAEPSQQLLTNSIDEATGQIVQAPIKRSYRQQVCEPLRKVQLEDGNSVTITHQHKLLTDKGWTNELRVGDYVCVPAKLVWEGKPEDPDLLKFLAWQIAEGYELIDQAKVTITQKDILVLEELLQCLYRLGKKHDINIYSPSICIPKVKVAYLRLSSRKYRRFLEAKGYEWGHLSRDKRIPDFIMQADLDSVRIFLRNFFEAEASVVESMRSIEISTASPLLMQQLSYLLRRFGIWMRISTKQKRATNGSGIFRPYQTGVLGGNAARRFCQEIGFAGEKKQQQLEKICEMVNNTNVEGIPASDIMARLVAATRLPVLHFGMNTVYIAGSQQFSPTSLKRVISALDNIMSGEAERMYREKAPSKWTVRTLNAYTQLDKQLLTIAKAKLQHLIDQEVFYCRIKSIEDIPYDGWVYDFEVEDHHNFVANNILCHNTIQLITLLLHDRDHTIGREESSFGPSLLICPMSIVGNWHRELQRFAPTLKVMIHHGHERLSGEAFVEEAKQHDIVITTYSLALRDKERLSAIEWEYVVVDEAQNIKNESAKQTQAIKSLNARHRIALTGTPVENRLSELWSIMEFLNPGYLGSGTDFRKRFSIPIERYHDADRAEMLKRVIQPFVLRRLKTDKSIIADLPDKMEMKVFCNLTQEQASLYEAVVKEMIEKIEQSEGIERKGLVLSTLLKLKQVCNHPAHFVADGSSLPGRSGKLARLEEMLEEALAAGDKALIFTQFAEMGSMLRHYLQERLGCEVFFLHGGTPKKQRDAMVQRFQEDKRGAPVFILSLKAGGVGLNLTAANHVFHFDRWWNPAVENQATDRAFRIGQQRNVQVHKFVCVGTLEERIDQMIEQKKVLAESIVGAGENWLTEMSTAQLKELFALSREAVGE